jgi:hypothetical protein
LLFSQTSSNSLPFPTTFFYDYCFCCQSCCGQFGWERLRGWKNNKEILTISWHCWEENIATKDIPLETMHQGRIAPEIYSDTSNPVTQAAVAAFRDYQQTLAGDKSTIALQTRIWLATDWL